ATFFLFAFRYTASFSGYSDIALGTAQIMGFRLMTNFRRPYFASSIREFWQRWHISLSTWFRDYVYVPLGGNRVGVFRWNFNILVTFLVSGLWHGANWTFIIWGTLHGIYQILGVKLKTFTDRILPVRKQNTKCTRHIFPSCICLDIL
ncbi:MAG: MBOAT family protein, partial [Bacteroidales bacterium]|nr:MBOAT family protein [Bacteroidales bacterium]